MSTRKYYRQMVRSQAAAHGAKPSKSVHNWRRILGLYPAFVGNKNQKPGSKQPALAYPVPHNSALFKNVGLFGDNIKEEGVNS